MRIPGAPNFRHLPLVKPRTLYRSDHLGSLDEGDVRAIRELGVRRVLDFRGAQERAPFACAVPGLKVHALSIEPTVVQQLNAVLAAGRTPTEAEVVGMMQDTYRGFVRGNTHRFAEFFSHLLESDEPTVFHCTAGKDRTGFAAALVLMALGAAEDEVMRDYLRTNELHEPHWLRTTALPPHVAQVLVRVQPEFLHAAFEAMEEEHRSFEAYLRGPLGVDEAAHERLRALYLGA